MIKPLAFCALVMSAALTGCGDNQDDSEGGVVVPDGGGTVVTTTDSYDVDPALCPENYPVGLTIETDIEAEKEEFTSIVACTRNDVGATYLKNNGDAVWALHHTGPVAGSINHYEESPDSVSFRALMRDDGLLAPGDEVVVDLEPGQLEWDIDLRMSVVWQGHELALDKIRSLGEAAVIAALKHESPAGAALAKCTFAVESYATELGDLSAKSEAELTDIITVGLGGGAAGASCTQAASEVLVPERTNPQQLVALSEELSHLRQDTEVIEALKTRVGTLDRFANALGFGFKMAMHR